MLISNARGREKFWKPISENRTTRPAGQMLLEIVLVYRYVAYVVWILRASSRLVAVHSLRPILPAIIADGEMMMMMMSV